MQKPLITTLTATILFNTAIHSQTLPPINVGHNNAATSGSIAIGKNNYAKDWGIAIGSSNAANLSVALGYGAHAGAAPDWLNLYNVLPPSLHHTLNHFPYYGEWAFAVGSEEGAFALNYEAVAMMSSSYALGHNSLAIGSGTWSLGTSSFSLGSCLKSISSHQISLGYGNKVLANQNPHQWIENDVLFSLGNGMSASAFNNFQVGSGSNAITTLKNGQTTLTNKFWNRTAPNTVPTQPEASQANALIVEGHAQLEGNLTVKGAIRIQPQGDLSMGPFTAE
jgi:hypothetical protein